MFDPDVCITTTLTVRPADYAIRCIEAHKHVPLWYFSRKGLCKAACVIRQSDKNDILMVTKADEGPAGLLMASKNMKLDHQLSFSEFIYANNLFLTAIDNMKWGNNTTNSFN